MRDGGYPIGAEFDRNAPYNQPIIKPIEVEVDVVVTMSLRTKIKVDDYEIEMEYDDDERKMIPIPNFENCDIEKQVEEQITLPTNTEQFKEWILDDFFVQTV